MTEGELPHLDMDEVSRVLRTLTDSDVRVVIGTFVDNAGVYRAKQVPVTRVGHIHSPGVGASPTWAVLCADDFVAKTPSFSVVGDMRLRADIGAIRNLGGGVAWAPFELADQQGASLGHCPRGVLRRHQASAEAEGLVALAAFEIEFTCFDAQTGFVGGGPACGIGPLLDHSKFIEDLHEAFATAGLEIEQFHAEYGLGQMELSMEPAPPMEAVDRYVLARIVLGRTARRNGLRLSFSPQPLVNGIGNGAHLHISFYRDGKPLFSGGDGPYGLSDEGGAILGGLVKWLPESMAVLAPSLLSATRLQPGKYSGAFACWGLENREAALRLCEATPGNIHGANVEIKCLDHSTNPYAALAVILGLSRMGIVERLELPNEVSVDPGALSDDERALRNIAAICNDQAFNLAMFQSSAIVKDVLGEVQVEAIVGVRSHEVEVARLKSIEELVEEFRYTWSA